MKIIMALLACFIFPVMADTTISAESQGTADASAESTAASGAYNNLTLSIEYNGSATLPECMDWRASLYCSPDTPTTGSRDSGNPSCRAEDTAHPTFKVFYHGSCDVEYQFSAVLNGVSDNGKYSVEVTHKETTVPPRTVCSADVKSPVNVDIAAGGSASSELVTSVAGKGNLTFKPSASGDDGTYHGLLSDDQGNGSVAYALTEGTWDNDHWTATLESIGIDFKAAENARPGDAIGSLTAEIACE